MHTCTTKSEIIQKDNKNCFIYTLFRHGKTECLPFVTCLPDCLHGVLWPLRLLCHVAGGWQGSCDAAVSIMEERSPHPAARLVYGSGKALCGHGEIDEDRLGECLSSSPSTVSSQSGSPRSRSPGSPAALYSLVLFKRPSCSPCFPKKKPPKTKKNYPLHFLFVLCSNELFILQSYIFHTWYVCTLHVVYYWLRAFKVSFLHSLWACLWAVGTL